MDCDDFSLDQLEPWKKREKRELVIEIKSKKVHCLGLVEVAKGAMEMAVCENLAI